MDPFFSEFSCDEMLPPFETCTLRFGHKDFVSFRQIELNFRGSMSWNTQPDCLEVFNEATEPIPPFFLGHNGNTFTELTSRFRFVSPSHGRMPGITRQFCVFHTDVAFARSSISSTRRTPVSERLSHRRSFSIAFRLRLSGTRG